MRSWEDFACGKRVLIGGQPHIGHGLSRQREGEGERKTCKGGGALNNIAPCVPSPQLDRPQTGRVVVHREPTSIDQRLRTPRAAGVAGIAFCLLFITGHLLIRSAIPPYGQGSAIEVARHSETIARSLNLVPFAGIAFLWFIAVLRDHLGESEDRFFATVFLGSGLLYIAMFFASAALAGGMLGVLSSGTENLVHTGTYAVSRAEINQLLNIYGIKMAGVFMISFSTISLRTRIMPRWLVFLGWALALLLLLSIGTIAWAPLVFPLWVFLLSIRILIENFRSPSRVDQNSALFTEKSR